MSAAWVDVAVLLVGVLAIGVAILTWPQGRGAVDRERGGRCLTWQLDDSRKTEIVSNEWLGKLQRLEKHGGMLHEYDVVIVWAKEFLDDDILYDVVRQNIRDLVRYVYVLDRCHADRFRTLVEQLKKEEDLEERLVENALDVILVRSELLLNNFVLMAAGTDRQRMYGGIIHGVQPFAWVRQDSLRAHAFFTTTLNLVKAVGASWYDRKHATSELEEKVVAFNRMFDLDDQIMDFADVGRIVKASDLAYLEDVPINLREVVSRTTMPKDVAERVDAVVARIGPGGVRRTGNISA